MIKPGPARALGAPIGAPFRADASNTMAELAAYRAAIERWEDEGGRALAEEPPRARPGDLRSGTRATKSSS